MKPVRSTLALLLAVGAAAPSTLAENWTVTLLEPAGANQSKALGAYGGKQCGFVNFTGQGSAGYWSGDAASFVDISAGRGWTSSAANAMSGDQIVVSALVMMTSAFVYDIPSNTFVDLSPAWSASTAMQGCSSDTNTQVGSGQQMMGVMLMWHGTRDSVVNLTPAGWVSAAAAGCAGDTQVGNGLPGFMGMGRPFLTRGTADSFVDLTPPGSTSAGVAGCDLDTQIGSVLWPSSMMGHACLWHGTAASCVDLPPSSAATACWDGVQAGNYVGSMGGFGKAVVWYGTAESAQDLHQFVNDQLGAQYVATEATGIDPVTGDVVGIAYTLNGPYLIPHAVMWHPDRGCEADFNGDQQVDFFDYLDFVALYDVCSQ